MAGHRFPKAFDVLIDHLDFTIPLESIASDQAGDPVGDLFEREPVVDHRHVISHGAGLEVHLLPTLLFDFKQKFLLAAVSQE